MSEAYQGTCYEALIAKGSQLSGSHMQELVAARHVVATAMVGVAADVITG